MQVIINSDHFSCSPEINQIIVFLYCLQVEGDDVIPVKEYLEKGNH